MRIWSTQFLCVIPLFDSHMIFVTWLETLYRSDKVYFILNIILRLKEYFRIRIQTLRNNCFMYFHVMFVSGKNRRTNSQGETMAGHAESVADAQRRFHAREKMFHVRNGTRKIEDSAGTNWWLLGRGWGWCGKSELIKIFLRGVVY